MWYPISVNFRRKPIKFCSSDRDLLHLYKQSVSYDRAKTEKIGDFCAHMVDFRRPGHISWSTCHGNIISTVAMVTITNYFIVQNSGWVKLW